MGIRCLAGWVNCQVAGISAGAGAPVSYQAWLRASVTIAFCRFAHVPLATHHN
jgi:hypothetical protein